MWTCTVPAWGATVHVSGCQEHIGGFICIAVLYRNRASIIRVAYVVSRIVLYSIFLWRGDVLPIRILDVVRILIIPCSQYFGVQYCCEVLLYLMYLRVRYYSLGSAEKSWQYSARWYCEYSEYQNTLDVRSILGVRSILIHLCAVSIIPPLL